MEQANNPTNPAQSQESMTPRAGGPETGMGFEAAAPEQYPAQSRQKIDWDNVKIDVDPQAVTFDWEKYRASLEQAGGETHDTTSTGQGQTDTPKNKPDWTAGCGLGWKVEDDPDKPAPKNAYRTLALARRSGAATIPDNLAMITLKQYQNALSPIKNDTAYLQPLIDEVAKHLKYEGNKFYYDGKEMTDTEIENKFSSDTTAIDNFDLFLILAIYSIILQEIQHLTTDLSMNEILALADDERFAMFPVVIYMPEFMRKLGWSQGINANTIQNMADRIAQYNSITGRMKYSRGFVNIPLMLSGGLNPEKNTLPVTSPYMNKLVIRIFEESIQKISENGKKRPKMRRNGRPYTLPAYSSLIKAGIVKEQNERAKTIVRIVVSQIERSGSHNPKIKAQTLVDRIDGLWEAVNNAERLSDKNKLLKRPFTKAWELLRTHTDLKVYYPDIILPEVTDVPKFNNIGEKTYIFSHTGKIDPTDPTSKKKTDRRTTK